MATVPSELRHVLLVGPPGSGKGTVGPYLSELLGVPHVSSGQLLRASVTGGDPHRIGEQVNRGHMIPDRIVAQVMAERLADGFILDGYPRNVRQAAELDRVLADDERRVQLVLELVVPDEVASARLSRRARTERPRAPTEGRPSPGSRGWPPRCPPSTVVPRPRPGGGRRSSSSPRGASGGSRSSASGWPPWPGAARRRCRTARPSW